MKKIINNVESALTVEETTAFEKQQKEQQEYFTIKDAEQEAKNQAQVSGNQKLLDLGLSQAEATALTGYKPEEE